jgi:hypothetical protein
MVTLTQELLHAEKIYLIIKLDYSVTKVCNGYTNKEFIRKYKKYPESNSIVLEWRNSKTIISQAAYKSLGKCKAIVQKKKLKIWDDEIKLIAQQQKISIQEVSSKKTIDHENE